MSKKPSQAARRSSTEQFPRSTDLPKQSPLFWVEQKDRYLRQLLIRDIEAATQRRLIAYFANRWAGAQIDARDVTLMAELTNDVDSEPVDLFLETTGGFTDAAEALISLLKATTSDLRVVVPGAAKSNGTLLALAASSVVMGAPSELGPIEPQVDGVPTSILSAPEFARINFILNQLGIYALQQTKSLAKSVLIEGMMNDKTAQEVDTVVETLASRDRYHSHGSVIDHQEAAQLGLKIEYLKPDEELWKQFWLLHCMYDHDCRTSGYLKVFEGRALSTAISIPVPAKPTDSE